MPYVSSNYANNANAPFGKWACAPTSSLQPYDALPPAQLTNGHNLCGQCVSYVKQVCAGLPPTHLWRKGDQVKNNTAILPGTVIATYDAHDNYHGHAAIYVSQSSAGINVYDQYVTGSHPSPVGPRLLKWGGHGASNNGDDFYVVE